MEAKIPSNNRINGITMKYFSFIFYKEFSNNGNWLQREINIEMIVGWEKLKGYSCIQYIFSEHWGLKMRDRVFVPLPHFPCLFVCRIWHTSTALILCLPSSIIGPIPCCLLQFSFNYSFSLHFQIFLQLDLILNSPKHHIKK